MATLGGSGRAPPAATAPLLPRVLGVGQALARGRSARGGGGSRRLRAWGWAGLTAKTQVKDRESAGRARRPRRAAHPGRRGALRGRRRQRAAEGGSSGVSHNSQTILQRAGVVVDRHDDLGCGWAGAAGGWLVGGAAACCGAVGDRSSAFPCASLRPDRASPAGAGKWVEERLRGPACARNGASLAPPAAPPPVSQGLRGLPGPLHLPPPPGPGPGGPHLVVLCHALLPLQCHCVLESRELLQHDGLPGVGGGTNVGGGTSRDTCGVR
jgi:hypothetical protein